MKVYLVVSCRFSSAGSRGLDGVVLRISKNPRARCQSCDLATCSVTSSGSTNRPKGTNPSSKQKKHQGIQRTRRVMCIYC